MEQDERQSAQSINKTSISRFRPILPQVIATSGTILQSLSKGMLLGFPTVVISALTDENNRSQPHFTMEEASWFAGLTHMVQPIGSILSGVTLQSLGCKKLMIFSNAPLLACWLMAYFSSSNAIMYCVSALAGLVLGLKDGLVIRYVTEISHPSVRGVLLSSMLLFVSIGFLLIIFLGSLFSWRHVALISSSIPIICTFILLMIPETPMWLMSKGRPEAALKSLQWLRGWTSEETVREEFEKIKFYAKRKTSKVPHSYEQEIDMKDEDCSMEQAAGNNRSNPGGNDRSHPGGNMKNESSNGSFHEENACAKRGWTEKLGDFTRKEMIIALIKSCTLFAVFSFTGMPILRPYLTKLFKELKFPIQPSWSSVWVALMGTLGHVTCMVSVKKVKKKPLLVFSLITSALSLILLAFSLMGYIPLAKDLDFYRWCPLVLFLALFFFYHVGIHPITWQYLGEILPYRGRGPATCIAVSFFQLSTFVGTRMFPTLKEKLKLEGVFLIYAAVCVGGIFFTYFLPETEGKFLSDIETETKCGSDKRADKNKFPKTQDQSSN